MLQAGKFFGGTYRLERSLGRGGMGEVWLAEHILLEEPRAIKIMLGALTDDPAVRQRFIKGEARNSLRLDRHPHIVRVYELGLHGNMPFIVMEYVKGTAYGASLKELLKHYGHFGLEQTGKMLAQLVSALEVAHALELVHRDVKPANILVDGETEDGPQLKLSDFGLTKDLDNGPELTMLGYALGTPAYMAPEQALGEPEVRSDQYSLGAIVYEMLTGQPPFSGVSASLILQHATDSPRPLSELNDKIPPEVNQVVLRALSKKPADRYNSVTEFLTAYRQAIQGYHEALIEETIVLPIARGNATKAAPQNLPNSISSFTPALPVTTPVAPPPHPIASDPIPPSGTLTFLFTDIEGSTKLWEQHPEAMGLALARHDDLLRQAIVEQGGFVFKTVGDAFCAAFASALTGLTAALNGQRALAAEPWGETGPIKVRMALHTGTAEERNGDYFGPTLNRVARLLSAGHGAQTLLSAATHQMIRDLAWQDGYELVDLGQHRLKDLIQPEQIYQINAPGLPTHFEPLKTLDNRPTNLPPQTTLLVGREKEAEEVGKLLGQPEVRLVTLLGPGGTGKTRLSLQVAADLLDQYTDGAFFVPLEPINDPALLLPAIAQALGVKESELPIADRLRAYLKDKQLLLVLDNFEQVVAGAGLVGDLLKAAQKVKGLVSSRIPLRLYGEREYAVPPLGLPNLKQLPTVAALEQFPAVALFVQRAQAVKADFNLTKENAASVAEICVRLDGLPLAIELAAARTKLLPPQAMLARLSNRLKLLTGGARDLTARQQTLRGAIDWSYDLLEEAEKRLLARLGVFNGGWMLEAAEAVCEIGMGGKTATVDVLDGIGSLLDKSLIRQQENNFDSGGEPRFVMLETIREYALERLTEFGETEAARASHANYYLELAEQAEKELRGPQQVAALKLLETEHDNLRTALSWAIEAGEQGQAIALRLVGTLWRFWVMNSYLSEGQRWLDSVLAKSGGPTIERAKALTGAGNLAWVLGNYERATALLNTSLTLRRELDDKPGIASVVQNLGNVALEQGDYDKATAHYQESLTLRRELGDKAEIAVALQSLGNLALEQDEYAQAITLYEESLALFRELDSKSGMIAVQQNLKVATTRQSKTS